jgi:hypothetical protein
MSLLLLSRTKADEPAVVVPDTTKTRNRVGIRNIIYGSMDKGQRVTLDEAIAILRAGW